MTDNDKRRLIKLLNDYQYELSNSDNIHTYGHGKYYPHGTKAQYNHARCIANKLSTEIGKDIRTW